MTKKPNDEIVDRSRLKLLGVLVAGSAAGGCGPMGAPVPIVEDDPNPFSTLQNVKSKKKPKPIAPTGGESGGEGGGGGGGGGSH